MSDIISRKEAKARGLLRYFTGKPCKREHVVERYVSSWGCVACLREWQENNPDICSSARKAWHEANRDYHNSVSRAWYEANIDRAKTSSKAWYRANSSRKNASSRAWREANSERNKALIKAWERANPGRRNAISKAWSTRNPNKVRAKGHNRRALEQSAEGSHTAQDIQNIYETQQGLCAYCKIDVGTNYHVDHIHPLSRGGSNGKENLQITCPTCNLKKHAKTHEEFLLDNHNDASILVPEHD